MKLYLFEQLYEKEAADDVSAYKISFGKYKGKSYKWIYENDKSYCVFLLKKLDYSNNKIMIDYLKEQIENEAEPALDEKPVEKKQRKPRAKKQTDEIKELLISDE
jgi:hypothetical protein